MNMPDGKESAALQQLRHILAVQEGHLLPDERLLERYLELRDETAFAAIVKRHRAMVYGVCRAVLCQAEDAEDACQATFLLLARKAAGIRKKNSLSAWLHGTAYRLALKLATSRK